MIRSAAILDAYRCLPATDGNLSARLDQETILITKSGIEKRGLAESSFAAVKLNDSNPPDVSSEWPMHRAIYRTRADVDCVLHAHPPYLTSFAVSNRTPDVRLLAETSELIGDIASVPFVSPGSSALAEALLAASMTAAVYLLANHGAVSVGRTVAEALHRMERAEFLAQVAFQAACMRDGIPITDASISSFSGHHADPGR
ncbi:MAG: class II aldolase/adducin family protein [bacterium]|nr:class II aldolase/adducin family protein [bacterium]